MAGEERPAPATAPAPAPVPVPQRKPRNRQSRGKGLRKTTGCITCRRRHVKCDETRPHCERCRKVNQTCIYADTHAHAHVHARPETSPQPGPGPGPGPGLLATLPAAVPLADPEVQQGRVRPPDWPQQQTPSTTPWSAPPPEQSLRYQPARSSDTAGGGVTSVPPSGQRASVQIDYLLNTPGPSPSLEPSDQHKVISPDMSAYAATPFSMSSSEQSIVSRSVSSRPTYNVAISRWFDMLVGDSAFEAVVPENETAVDDVRGMGTPRETPRGHDRTSSAPFAGSWQSSAACGRGYQAASPASSNPQLLERNPPLMMSAASENWRWQAEAPIELLPRELFIFRNFVERISLWIDLFDPTQSFSSFVPHLAIRNVGLLKAILALSARHISLMSHPDITPGQTHDRNDALQYYNETLHYLSKAMQYDSYKTSLELLATALIVSTYEMLDGSGKDWERHLQGVFWIQRSQVIHGDSKGLKQAVWWAWLCQDVWAAFREKRRTFTFWKPTRTFAEMNPYGLASRAVYIIAKVVNYCSKEESEGGDMKTRTGNAEKLQGMLDEWERFLTVEFSPLPYKSDEVNDAFQPIWIHPPAFAVAMQLHYSARLLLLLNKPSKGGFGGYLEQSQMISKYINNICGIAMTLNDYASTVMNSQCLYIAGMCVQDVQQRQTVLRLLEKCWQRSGWPVTDLGEELKAFWDTPEGGPRG
ncbi:uncharacterized protein L3040_006797 [Drepanopeziza brunnea f. sp. 'multigermtubi']|uniref:Zn(2)-C6 fungal-type domain-containing protein n=1 Tax=Marssonina brunnea f. sp. multigermtubi (strain MB_m1) TaxID=1072389 RepID=K1XER9_MARBU|nr:uncharacterized protein MBM_02655 [Drepanopeziza brunnea f. sp. 'multigermtubi' MB_m1]EKD19418.1 hypothetical protein MBM_02655 [Drepanopeziza brunnea f. sp. 'multigermtubi' MB_m1]KAJ5037921.1 hypothetical protein L3040_006797 [Drepanopeziza brunnea f. sp. 'multigermtubi']